MNALPPVLLDAAMVTTAIGMAMALFRREKGADNPDIIEATDYILGILGGC